MIDWNTSNEFDQNMHYYFLDTFSTPGFYDYWHESITTVLWKISTVIKTS